MQTLIVYDPQFGNTAQIAHVVDERFGSAQLIRAHEAGALEHIGYDLLIVAGQMQRLGMSPAVLARTGLTGETGTGGHLVEPAWIARLKGPMIRTLLLANRMLCGATPGGVVEGEARALCI